MEEVKKSIFYKYLCDYVLGNIPEELLIDAAIETVTSGFESDNLYILAGLSKQNFDYNDVQYYFELSLTETKTEKPNKKDAAEYLVIYYCEQLLKDIIDAETFLSKIMSDVYYKTWNDFSSTKFVGDYLGLEHFIGAFWELDDLENELVQYSKDVNREKEKIKIYNSCKKLAENYINEKIKI